MGTDPNKQNTWEIGEMKEHLRPAKFCCADPICSKKILTNDVIFKCNFIWVSIYPGENG